MPVMAINEQKRFKLTIREDLPVVVVDVSDNGYVMKCCPLCGCTHQLIKEDNSKPYAPLCQTLPGLYKDSQKIWRKAHPEIGDYTALHLISK